MTLQTVIFVKFPDCCLSVMYVFRPLLVLLSQKMLFLFGDLRNDKNYSFAINIMQLSVYKGHLLHNCVKVLVKNSVDPLLGALDWVINVFTVCVFIMN